jgi:sugar phosphate isomerase/epimerase/type 1 glutamine amidotransferase
MNPNAITRALAAVAAGALLAPQPSLAQQPAWTVIGWRVGIQANSFRPATTFEAIDQAAAAGAKFIEGYAAMKVSAEIPKNLDWSLTEPEMASLQQKLRSAGVAVPNYYTRNIPNDEESIRKLFGFAKALGVETIVGEPPAEQLAFIDRFAGEYGINVALHGHTRKVSPVYWDPKNQMQALEGRSRRMGVCPDIGHWAKENIKPLDGLAVVKDRLLCMHLRDLDQFSANAREVPLGTGALDVAGFLHEVYRLNIKPTLLGIEEYFGPADASRQMSQSVAFLNQMVSKLVGEKLDETSRNTSTRWQVPAEDRQKIADAIPRQAPAKPRQPRKLLVVDLQAAYAGHRSVPYGNIALQEMGRRTGAFEAVFNNDLANLRYEKLSQYDALYLNNTVGPILNAADLRESLLRYVREGGGLGGHHGTSRASLDWPEFAEMLGSYSGPHGESNEKVTVKIDDPASPINAVFGGKPFEFTDEFFRFPTPPYSREKLHILLSFDVSKTDMRQGRGCGACARADNDYAISWIRSYGKGRVFFSSFGNGPSVYWAPQILQHFLAGIQFILGDLDADTTPSAQLGRK